MLVQEIHSYQVRDSSRTLAHRLTRARAASLQFSSDKLLQGVSSGAITWLDLDSAEQRYLLAGSADGSILVYDVLQPASEGGGPFDTPAGEHSPVLRISRQNPEGHKYLVTGVCWYPIDTGLFVSCSSDCTVKVWDTNQQMVACKFEFSDRIFGVGMSPLASSHCLVAVASDDPTVKLCDPTTGGCMHSLVGHRHPVLSVTWALGSEHQLVSAGGDGEMRLWDVRTYNCLHVFDQHQTRKPRKKRPRGAVDTAADLQANTAQARAQAHAGTITCVQPTEDGLHWVSAGTDSRMRLWDTRWHRNLLVNYPSAFNRSLKARQISVSSEAGSVFHPSGSIIQCFDLYSGKLVNQLKGHLDTVNACCWNSSQHELYTGSGDSQIVVWSPPRPEGDLETPGMHDNDEDAWSN